MYARGLMARTVIMSEDTVRALLEANASLAAWYHEFVRASREQTPVSTPGDVTRKAFLDRLAQDHPEVASVVSTMGVPPVYVPPPLGSSFGTYTQQAQPQPQPPQTWTQGYGHPHQGHGQPAQQPIPTGTDEGRPPMVNPRLVKY